MMYVCKTRLPWSGTRNKLDASSLRTDLLERVRLSARLPSSATSETTMNNQVEGRSIHWTRSSRSVRN